MQPGCKEQVNERSDRDHTSTSSVPSIKKKFSKFKRNDKKVPSIDAECQLVKSAYDLIKEDDPNQDSF